MRCPTRKPAAGRGPAAILAVWLVSCAAAPPDGVPAPPPRARPAPAASVPKRDADAKDRGADAPVASGAAIAEPPAQLLTWEGRLDSAVASFALGKKRVAALGRVEDRYGPAWILDGGKVIAAPLPERLLAGANQRDDLRVYFGRDDWPRVLGARFEGDHAAGVYLRHRNGWRREPGEIARLMQPPDAAFFGVLGHDDPEIVCEVGDTCIVKRLSGWTFVPAGSERLEVELTSGIGWGFGPANVSRMTDRGWERVGGEPTWKVPTGVWSDADGALWVSEAATDSLHHWDGQRWTRVASPVAGPRGLWGAAANDVWLAAAGGVAHWDGTGWRRVAAPEGTFGEVRGRGPRDVWIAGAGGLWQGSR